MQQRRLPGERAGLTRGSVLAAAQEVLAERGLDAVTMRALAQHLGVSPNSLYSHVANKTALIDALLDELLADVDEPDPSTAAPSQGLFDLMASTYAVLVTRPDLVPHYLTRQGARGPNATRLGDTMLALLAREGVHGPQAREALRVLIVYTIGFAALTTSSAAEPDAALSSGELAGNFRNGLTWLIAGVIER